MIDDDPEYVSQHSSQRPRTSDEVIATEIATEKVSHDSVVNPETVRAAVDKVISGKAIVDVRGGRQGLVKSFPADDDRVNEDNDSGDAAEPEHKLSDDELHQLAYVLLFPSEKTSDITTDIVAAAQANKASAEDESTLKTNTAQAQSITELNDAQEPNGPNEVKDPHEAKAPKKRGRPRSRPWEIEDPDKPRFRIWHNLSPLELEVKRREAQRLAEQGLKVAAIAKLVHESYFRVYSWLKKKTTLLQKLSDKELQQAVAKEKKEKIKLSLEADLLLQKKQEHNEKRQLAVHYYVKGMKPAEITQKLGITINCFNSWIKLVRTQNSSQHASSPYDALRQKVIQQVSHELAELSSLPPLYDYPTPSKMFSDMTEEEAILLHKVVLYYYIQGESIAAITHKFRLPRKSFYLWLRQAAAAGLESSLALHYQKRKSAAPSTDPDPTSKD